jgi:hypothetical protein
VIGLTMLLFERMWIFGLWIWNSVECFKWGLMGHPSRNMEDFVAVIWAVLTWPKGFQRKRISKCSIKTFFVVFWWMWLLFALVWTVCLRRRWRDSD